MHWCPECNYPCYCDSDDTDLGEQFCNGHECIEYDEDWEHDDNAEGEVDD